MKTVVKTLHAQELQTTPEAFYARLFAQNERVMKFGLTAIQSALSRESGICRYPHILVAGTNGKGQVSALLSNALTLSGIQTGLFTSPHLVDFRERIRINGCQVTTEDIVRVGSEVLAEYGGDSTPAYSGTTLTYFECCLMMALRQFKASNVQFGVFEVGLGGRLDATNALNPSLSIITSISRDHEDYLGHEIEQIAREKAGIMRPGCPVICGRSSRDVLRQEAEKCGCSSFDALGESFEWHEIDGQVWLVYEGGKFRLSGTEKYAGYQRDNAAVAAFAWIKLQTLGILPLHLSESLSVLETLFQRTRWVGRLWPCSAETAQKFGVDEIILDAAHNEDGVRALLAAIRQRQAGRRMALVVNSCRDKGLESMFSQYLEVFRSESIYIVPIASTARACTPHEYCARVGLAETQASLTLADGIRRAAENVGRQGVIYISGSLYLLGEALTYLKETQALESILI